MLFEIRVFRTAGIMTESCLMSVGRSRGAVLFVGDGESKRSDSTRQWRKGSVIPWVFPTETLYNPVENRWISRLCSGGERGTLRCAKNGQAGGNPIEKNS